MIYLDYNASTPMDPRVVDATSNALELYGNASSIHHRRGAVAAEAIEGARDLTAVLFGCSPQDVIFTSGATEAAAIALLGVMLGSRGRPNIVLSASEHKAIIEAAGIGARLSGGKVRIAGVDDRGVVDLDHLQSLVDDSVAIVAVMAANNETGVLGPVDQVAEIARVRGSLNFVDVTQLAGKGPLKRAMECADISVCSSHKMYGPKGAGALIANRAVQKRLAPILGGGGQERGLRGGTHNTAAIVGFGVAAEIASKEGAADETRIGVLTRILLNGLTSGLRDVRVNGDGAQRLTNTLNLRFVGADAEAVMASIPDICVSSGSACQAASATPSHVLLAMGRTRTEAEESLRISLGRPTSEDEVDAVVPAIIDAVSRVRALSAA